MVVRLDPVDDGIKDASQGYTEVTQGQAGRQPVDGLLSPAITDGKCNEDEDASSQR